MGEDGVAYYVIERTVIVWQSIVCRIDATVFVEYFVVNVGEVELKMWKGTKRGSAEINAWFDGIDALIPDIHFAKWDAEPAVPAP